MENEKVFAMSTGKIYAALTAKAERKGRTKQEVDTVIGWLTGYAEEDIARHAEQETPYKTFFDEAPCLNPERDRIKGSICGIKVETIEDPTMKLIRQLDKLIDELAKGKSMEKILHRA